MVQLSTWQTGLHEVEVLLILYPALHLLQVELERHFLQFAIVDKQFYTQFFLFDDRVEILLQVLHFVTVKHSMHPLMEQNVFIHVELDAN